MHQKLYGFLQTCICLQFVYNTIVLRAREVSIDDEEVFSLLIDGQINCFHSLEHVQNL